MEKEDDIDRIRQSSRLRIRNFIKDEEQEEIMFELISIGIVNQFGFQEGSFRNLTISFFFSNFILN